ncbi:uncharacterized protein LOC108451022 [Gossypium arboreum]|uniref:uncharacterized protein LOC108451022 n=1 Tax=Gossypium arboreum TaxID=29729 RepID=UPI000818FC73|nr:uncharacterized protein LOC108451022 [Gossypium arboreum]
MEKVCYTCGYANGIEVNSESTSGRLCLAWRNEIGFTLQSYSKKHIDVMVDDNEARGTSMRSCIVLKKRGGLPRDERRMERFRNVLSVCQLTDVGFSGNWFTWEKGNLPETNIRERLDRRVANKEWMAMFPEVIKRPNKKRFKFEAWWLMEESFEENVKISWETSSGNLLQKLDMLKDELQKWDKNRRLERRRRKDFLTAILLELTEAKRDDEKMVELIDAKIQLNFEIEKDERYWEQRARVDSLKFGDKNTTYFHSQATQRRRRNLIHKLKDE